MPGVPRAIPKLTADERPIRLVVIAFDHIAIGIALGHH